MPKFPPPPPPAYKGRPPLRQNQIIDGSESDPLVLPGNRNSESLMLRRYNNRADDDDVSSQESGESRNSSIFSSTIFPWAFNGLSRNLLPSSTEIVVENEENTPQLHSDIPRTVGSDSDSSFCSEDDESIERKNLTRFSPTIRGRKYPSISAGSLKNPQLMPHRVKRSFRRRIFLLLTEPQSSIFSAIFFMALILTIAMSNILMMMQTMNAWQYTPDECVECEEQNILNTSEYDPNLALISCQCPPVPKPSIVGVEDGIIMFFAIEWSLRVICYVPSRQEQKDGSSFVHQWLLFLVSPSTLFDALAIFPYYMERMEVQGFLSLRLLRFFRVFQLLRLGKYNVTFISLTNVLLQSILSLNILIIALVFGATFFGSIIYFFEKGEWKYTTYTDPPSYMFMRIGADGVTEEPSPFLSIPAAFWWFIVTSTTVGYGDVYPTSVGGKIVGAVAMLTGVLVIAFPVSVFSDLWSKELKKAGALDHLESDSLNGFDEDFNKKKETELTETKEPPIRQRSSDVSFANTLGFPDAIKEFKRRKEAKEHKNIKAIATDDKPNNLKKEIALEHDVMLSQNDIKAIYRHLALIEENQMQILRLLKGK